MRVDWSELSGVSLEPAVRFRDERGSFEKLYDGSAGPLGVTQLCTSYNAATGTVRGLHVQVAPHLERKALWCTSGELFDVLVDTRPDEPTYGCWAGVHLTAVGAELLRLPPGIAHGYQTLAADTALCYLIDGDFAPGSARTLRWDDPTVQVEWPLPVTVMSDSDRDGRPWPVS